MAKEDSLLYPAFITPPLPKILRFQEPTPHTIEPINTDILMPSPRVQWREPPHNLLLLIGYSLVQIDDMVMAIGYVIAVDITAVTRVSISCVFHDGRKCWP